MGAAVDGALVDGELLGSWEAVVGDAVDGLALGSRDTPTVGSLVEGALLGSLEVCDGPALGELVGLMVLGCVEGAADGLSESSRSSVVGSPVDGIALGSLESPVVGASVEGVLLGT